MSQLHPKQINLRQLFSVKDVLASKGFIVTKEGNCATELLISVPGDISPENDFLFKCFNDSEKRFQLLSKVNDPLFEVQDLEVLKLTNDPSFIIDRNRYSKSFEWYSGELLIREFAAFSASFGVEIQDVYRNSIITAATGDYDCLVISRDIGIIYLECKTGGFNRSKILKFIERSLALHSEINVLFSEERLQLMSLLPMLKGLVHPSIERPMLEEINVKGKSNCNIYRYANIFFLSAAADIAGQLRTILRLTAAKALSPSYIDLDDETYEKIGYEKKLIERFDPLSG